MIPEEDIMFSSKRSFLNTVLVVSAILSLITGVFLFLHIKSFLIKEVHTYGSLVFTAACVYHLVLNWKPLLRSVSGHLSTRSMAALLIITTLIMAYSGLTADPNARRQRATAQEQQFSATETMPAQTQTPRSM